MALTVTNSASVTPFSTTIFTPPPSCFVGVAWYDVCDEFKDCSLRTTSNSNNDVAEFFALPTQSYASCLPPGWGLDSWYSLGVCPGGYEVANSSSTFSTWSWSGFAIETHGTCCPKLYSYDTGSYYGDDYEKKTTGCFSITTVPSTYTVSLQLETYAATTTVWVDITETANDATRTVVSPSKSTSIYWTYSSPATTYLTSKEIVVFAPSIMIRYSSATSDSLSTATLSGSQASYTSFSRGDSPEARTTGKTIGVGISVPMAVIGIFLGLILFFRHRKHKRLSRAAANKDTTKPDYLSLKPELGTDAETQRYELHGFGRNENALELDAVDTSYLKELGTEFESTSRRDEIIKISGQDPGTDMVVVQKKS